MAAASVYDQIIASMDAFGGEVGTTMSNVLDVGEYLTDQIEAMNDADLDRQQHLERSDTQMAFRGGHASSGSRAGNQYADEADAKSREKTYENGRGPANSIQAGLSMQQQILGLKEDIDDLREDIENSEISEDDKHHCQQRLEEARRLAEEGKMDEARDIWQDVHSEYQQSLEADEESIHKQTQDILNSIEAYKGEANNLEDTAAPLFAGPLATGQSGNMQNNPDSEQALDVAEIETAIDHKIQDIQENTLNPLEDKLADMRETMVSYEETVTELRSQLEDAYDPRGRNHLETQLDKAENNLAEMQSNYQAITQTFSNEKAVMEASEDVDIQALHNALTDDGEIDREEWQQEITNNIDNSEALAEIAEHLEDKLGEKFSDGILDSYDRGSDNEKGAQSDTPSDTAEHNGADAGQSQTAGNTHTGSAAQDIEPLSLQPIDLLGIDLTNDFTEASQGDTGRPQPRQENAHHHDHNHDSDHNTETARANAGPRPSGHDQPGAAPDPSASIA